MPNIQIKDVPAEAHAVLRERASAAHQSLQEYLLTLLVEQASRPTVDEVLDRVEGRHGGRVDIALALDTLDADRARR